MATELPKDRYGEGIQAMSPLEGGAQQVALTTASARQTTAFGSDTKVIGVYSTVDVFIELGSSTVTALVTDHFLPGSTYMMLSVKDHDHIAGILASGTGTLYVSEFE
jgi:S-adenosylmethionine:tRNA-ribosyltransferase-isomerase (queuine synthetase)